MPNTLLPAPRRRTTLWSSLLLGASCAMPAPGHAETGGTRLAFGSVEIAVAPHPQADHPGEWQALALGTSPTAAISLSGTGPLDVAQRWAIGGVYGRCSKTDEASKQEGLKALLPLIKQLQTMREEGARDPGTDPADLQRMADLQRIYTAIAKAPWYQCRMD